MGKIQESQFKRLKNSISLSKQSKHKMKHVIMNTSQKEKKHILPKVLSFMLIIFVIGFSYTLISNHNKMNYSSQGEITDFQTPETLPNVEISNNMFTIEWLSDSMDRGNHDLITDVHGKLVVLKDFDQIERGNIVYYKINEQEQVGRVIGLEGETVEIKRGQVYIDNKQLNTFYGTATSLGLTKDEYFDKVDRKNINKQQMNNYFNTSMEPILVDESSVFILVDMWWRGRDSREYGLISLDQLEGIIIGYELR